MKMLETPYIVEFLFALSTIVFVITLYAILPALIYNKKTLFKPVLINALWQKFYKNFFEGFEKLSRVEKKKELKKAYIMVDNNFEPLHKR